MVAKRFQENDDDDVRGFHAIPILNQNQLQLVRGLCTMRDPSDITESSWTELDVLKLEGVVRLSYQELQEKLRATDAIRAAIDDTVAKIARCSSNAELQCLKASPVANRIGGSSPESPVLLCRSVLDMSTSPMGCGVRKTAAEHSDFRTATQCLVDYWEGSSGIPCRRKH